MTIRNMGIIRILLLVAVVSTKLADAGYGGASILAWIQGSSSKQPPEPDSSELAPDMTPIITGGCGRSEVPLQRHRSKRLAGGYFAISDSVPWMVSFRVRQGERAHGTLCAGVLIRVSNQTEASDIVLMTARCNDRDYAGKNPRKAFKGQKGLSSEAVETEANVTTNVTQLSDFYAVLGSQYQTTSSPYVERVDVAEIVFHPDYDNPRGSYSNDIAIAKLSKPVIFSRAIQPICMPKQGERLEEGEVGIVTGWGDYYGPMEEVEDGIVTIGEKKLEYEANYLRYLKLPILEPESCLERKKFIPESMLCVKYKEDEEEGPCGWDSGIPYFFTGPDGFTLQGIVGHDPADRCGQNSSTTFTRVASYVDWIQQQITILSDVPDQQAVAAA